MMWVIWLAWEQFRSSGTPTGHKRGQFGAPGTPSNLPFRCFDKRALVILAIFVGRPKTKDTTWIWRKVKQLLYISPGIAVSLFGIDICVNCKPVWHVANDHLCKRTIEPIWMQIMHIYTSHTSFSIALSALSSNWLSIRFCSYIMQSQNWEQFNFKKYELRAPQ